MSAIDISKLDKAEVLAALFNASRQQGMGFLDKSGASVMSVEDARKLTSDGSDQYYDYLRGRVMKIDLSGDQLRTGLYDRDNGEGAAARALAPLLAAVSEVGTTPATPEITRQALDAGKIIHSGWTSSRDTADQCGVNVLDYFGKDGKFLGADENGLAPTFEAADVDYSTVATEVHEYRFVADSEQGLIMARDFTEAKQMLRDKIDDTDGGEGWVEDQDGYRFSYSAR